MTSPLPPRLPELAGMTEAGFNRVVAMIQPWDFRTRHHCTKPWGWDFPVGCVKCQGICAPRSSASSSSRQRMANRSVSRSPRWR